MLNKSDPLLFSLWETVSTGTRCWSHFRESWPMWENMVFKSLNLTSFIAAATKIINTQSLSHFRVHGGAVLGTVQRKWNKHELWRDGEIWANGMEVKVPGHQRTKLSHSCGQEKMTSMFIAQPTAKEMKQQARREATHSTTHMQLFLPPSSLFVHMHA